MRGEGATLHGADGERFVDELAPRDAVARAIFNELARTGAPSVGLDMRGVDPGRFPNVVAALREAGLDPMRELVPVAPASHYVMGGIVTDLEGRADGVPGLFAVGECACTGLHGANRLASNSLSECFVFGRRAALAGLAGEPARSAPAARLPGRRRWPRRRAARRARRCGATPASSAAPRGSRRCSATPTRWPGWWPPARSRARSRRGAHARSDFPGTDSTLDGRHTIAGPGDAPPRTDLWE